jgi:hypothetical protein
MSLWTIIGALWWAVDVAGFVYTWTARYDFTTEELVLAVMSGSPCAEHGVHAAQRPRVSGAVSKAPFAWLFSWFLLIRKPRRRPSCANGVRRSAVSVAGP